MAKLEQAVADIFNSNMNERCCADGQRFHAFSLGGQDRDLGADYLISNAIGFSLIEFKNSEVELVSEGSKQRRRRLCELLQENSVMRQIHDKCHFVAWSDTKSGDLHCAPYRTEICNQHIFSNCTILKQKKPIKCRHLLAQSYCDEFISPPPNRYAEKNEFEIYLAWLMTVASGLINDTVELMARKTAGCTSIRFDSVDAACNWMKNAPKLSKKRRITRP